MDTPNSAFGLIRKFPIDILARIMLLVPGEDIGRLKMTGCKSLWSILTCQNVVKSVKLGNGGIRFKSWPSFLNEFPSLESLRIKNHVGQWWSDLGLALNQLPSTLRNLSLRITGSGWSSGRFFQPAATLVPFRLDEHLPHLEALQIVDIVAPDLEWVSHCPPTLTSLAVHHWTPDIALPSSLIHFKSFDGIPTVLSPTLESLSFGSERFILQHTFPCLTSLSANLGNCELVKLEDVRSLPKSLTILKACFSPLPSVTWVFLPTNLKSLSFYANIENCTVTSRKVDPISGEVHQFETFPIELLPKSLTNLHIDGDSDDPMFVSGICSSLFPPHLKSFDATCLILAPNAAKQLPSSLTHLSTSHFYEQLCEHLPQGLTSLSLGTSMLLSPKTIQRLPKSLTFLSGSLRALWKEEWFDYTTGKPIPLSSLPEYSIHKDYPSYFACLPPNLTSLELDEFEELQDDFIRNQNFPNLLRLTLWKTDQLSDNCIPLLNRHLKLLEVMSSPHVTGKCFESLPRSLTHLELGSSSNIFDEDIKHLPRTLKTIVLPYATSLSNACIRDFPRGCEDLRINGNQTITQLCIPDFPLSLTSFQVEDWGWICRKVYSRG